MSTVELTAIRADVAEVDSDVLLLKYARRFYGADEKVAFRLKRCGVIRDSEVDPAVGESVRVETAGAIVAPSVMFLGTPRLGEFRYKQMREYACKAIELVDQHYPDITNMATTVHGAGYGLDIEESLHALIFGFQQALSQGLAPKLQRITLVERNGRRFDIISRAIAAIPGLSHPPGVVSDSVESGSAVVESVAELNVENQPADSVVQIPEKKKLVFVAMPFEQQFEDVYQFGIYEVVRRCGFVCERVDESYYAGSIIDRIKEGIQNADFVIADLTTERPNVYLEVGYAWGLNRPVVLIAKEGQKLHFDLAQHKCIFYPTIVRLADELEKTIRDMFMDKDGKA